MRKEGAIFIILAVLLTACPTPEVLPDVPMVEYKSFILEKRPGALGDSLLTGTLTMHFEDGDGDIGFNARTDSLFLPDTLRYNLFLSLHEMRNGKYHMLDTSELASKPFYRIPPLDREGQNKTLRGEIEIEIEYFTIDYDTLRYSFYLMDRAYHRSNRDTTDEIIFTDWR